MTDRMLVQRVKDATDLVALVGQSVKLRKQGSAHVGLCPFHSERTPSFQVVPTRQFWHCFGCGKNGDAISWLQERDGLSFGEAFEQLAQAAGIELPVFRERPKIDQDLEARIRTILETAQAYYVRRLKETPKALNYLRERGMSDSFVLEAGFGFAADAWEDLLNHLKQHGYSPELAEQAGLASRTERGSLIDFMRDRLTIPILDVRGRLVAFGGRAFGDAKPKYMNSRETPVFHKGELLFGLHRAKGFLKDGALIVEGYFDVLQLHQQGIPQAVAPLGTALREEHLQLLSRFGKRLVLCFDGDAAGRNAMEKALRVALPLGFEVRLLELPAGEDPDTWCIKLGAEAFREVLRQAPDWTGFILDRASEGKDLRRVQDRMSAFRELLDFLPHLAEGTASRELLGGLAHQLQMPMSEVLRAVKERRTKVFSAAPSREAGFRNLEMDERLRPLVLACRDASSCAEVMQWPAAWWEQRPGAALLQAMLDAEGEESALPEEALADLRRLEAAISRRDELPSDRPIAQLGEQLEEDFVQQEIQALQRQLREPSIQAEARILHQVESRLVGLLSRKSLLQRRIRTRPPNLE